MPHKDLWLLINWSPLLEYDIVSKKFLLHSITHFDEPVIWGNRGLDRKIWIGDLLFKKFREVWLLTRDVPLLPLALRTHNLKRRWITRGIWPDSTYVGETACKANLYGGRGWRSGSGPPAPIDRHQRQHGDWPCCAYCGGCGSGESCARRAGTRWLIRDARSCAVEASDERRFL